MNNPTTEEEFEEDGSSYYSSQQQVKYINVYKHLSEANPLLEKVEFEAYHVNVVLPVHFSRLPNELRDTNHAEGETNMSKLDDSLFYHEKLKEKLDRLLSRAPEQKRELEGTLFDRYANAVPCYRKFLNFDRRYFATAVIDLKGINRKRKLLHPPSSEVTSSRELKTVEFDSNFESGNLYHAYQVAPDHYELVLQNDINTRGNNQWFFFRVRNVQRNRTLRFSIVNLIKPDSLFNYGMKPTVFSKGRYERRKIGWVREGQKISYEPNSIKRECKDAHFYTLSFEYKFQYDDDTVYFSHSYPYTYSDLSNYLTGMFARKEVGRLATIKNLGRTVGKNRIDLLTITARKNNIKEKRIVWILARQHPGEVTSSFVVEGMIDFLVGENRAAEYLRDNLIFKIVPMVNTDGVIHGNSRCELVGTDPNRRWKEPSKLLHPVIYQIRKNIEKGVGSIDMVLDLHSHSRKLGTFFYGNSQLHKPEASRVYPLFVCKNDQRFSFQDSRFGGGYATTARSALFRMLKIPKVYTVESSFYAYEKGKDVVQYLPDDYRNMGRSLLENYASLLLQENPQLSTPINSLRKTSDLKQVLKDLKLPEVLEQGDKESAGSDSDPSQDQFEEEELVRLLPKKLELRKKKRKLSKMKDRHAEPPKLEKRETPMEKLKQRQPQPTQPVQIRSKVSDFIRKNASLSKEDSRMKYTTSIDGRGRSALTRKLANPLTRATQTQPIDESVLRQNANRTIQYRTDNLCVIGQKVEEKEVWLGEGEVGTQTLTVVPRLPAPNKDMLVGRGSLRPPKFFNVAPMKENNFLLREYSLRR